MNVPKFQKGDIVCSKNIFKQYYFVIATDIGNEEQWYVEINDHTLFRIDKLVLITDILRENKTS